MSMMKVGASSVMKVSGSSVMKVGGSSVMKVGGSSVMNREVTDAILVSNSVCCISSTSNNLLCISLFIEWLSGYTDQLLID